MTKIHFRSYNPNQTVLFPQRIDEDITENDPVRMVDALVEGLNLESFRKLYKECGRSPYHPRMMLKVILYAYMNNIYSCRKIEKLLHRDIHYIWLAGYEKPDFITINRFRNRVKKEINEVFTQTVVLLSSKGFIRSEEHTSELQSRENLVCRLLLEKKKKKNITDSPIVSYNMS